MKAGYWVVHQPRCEPVRFAKGVYATQAKQCEAIDRGRQVVPKISKEVMDDFVKPPHKWRYVHKTGVWRQTADDANRSSPHRQKTYGKPGRNALPCGNLNAMVFRLCW